MLVDLLSFGGGFIDIPSRTEGGYVVGAQWEQLDKVKLGTLVVDRLVSE